MQLVRNHAADKHTLNQVRAGLALATQEGRKSKSVWHRSFWHIVGTGTRVYLNSLQCCTRWRERGSDLSFRPLLVNSRLPRPGGGSFRASLPSVAQHAARPCFALAGLHHLGPEQLWKAKQTTKRLPIDRHSKREKCARTVRNTTVLAGCNAGERAPGRRLRAP